jgi:parvulin-like peptidyl-prolyl isomerase
MKNSAGRFGWSMLCSKRAKQPEVGAVLGSSYVMKHIRLVIVFAVTALLVVGCGSSGSSESVPNDAVAVVGGNTISKDQYNQVLTQAKRSYAAQHRTFPKEGTQAFTTLRGQIIQFLVERSEYEQAAKDQGVNVSDKDVDNRLEQVKRYQQQLKAQGLTDADVRDGLRYQLLRNKLYEKVTNDVKASDGDAKKYYDDHKAQYQQPALPESRDVRHILVKSKAKADTVYNQLKSGADFAKLAAKDSVDPSKSTGGRLTVCKEQAVSCIKTVAPFEKVAFSLKANQISKPVHTRFGWHVIQALGPVKAAKKAQPIPFDQVKAAIKQQLLQQKKQDEMTKWWNDTKKGFAKKTAYQTGYAPPASASQTTTTG